MNDALEERRAQADSNFILIVNQTDASLREASFTESWLPHNFNNT